MKILLFFIFLSYLSYGQNKLVKTSLLEKTKSHHINYPVNYPVNYQPHTYVKKFNIFISSINKNSSPLNQKIDFYKAYFKTANILKEKQITFKSFSPQFNRGTFSLPLKYKYKNGSTCFYILNSCKK